MLCLVLFVEVPRGSGLGARVVGGCGGDCVMGVVGWWQVRSSVWARGVVKVVVEFVGRQAAGDGGGGIYVCFENVLFLYHY